MFDLLLFTAPRFVLATAVAAGGYLSFRKWTGGEALLAACLLFCAGLALHSVVHQAIVLPWWASVAEKQSVRIAYKDEEVRGGWDRDSQEWEEWTEYYFVWRDDCCWERELETGELIMTDRMRVSEEEFNRKSVGEKLDIMLAFDGEEWVRKRSPAEYRRGAWEAGVWMTGWLAAAAAAFLWKYREVGPILGSKQGRVTIPDAHKKPVDPVYASINIEDVGVYQRYFERILDHVDVSNYTNWSMDRSYNREQIARDDDWMQEVLLKSQEDGLSGELLCNIVHQFFFADILDREGDRVHWVRRVMHPAEREYFPGGAQTMALVRMSHE